MAFVVNQYVLVSVTLNGDIHKWCNTLLLFNTVVLAAPAAQAALCSHADTYRGDGYDLLPMDSELKIHVKMPQQQHGC